MHDATTVGGIKIIAFRDLVMPQYDAKTSTAFTNILVIDFD